MSRFKKRVEVREIGQEGQEVGFRRKTVNSEFEMITEYEMDVIKNKKDLGQRPRLDSCHVKSVERVVSRGEGSFGE